MGNQFLTYNQLNNLSNQFARYLATNGVQKGKDIKFYYNIDN